MPRLLNHTALMALAAALLLPALPACSSASDDEPAAPAAEASSTVQVSIAASTRAEADAESDDELIHDWWVAFVDAKNRVERIVSRADGSTTPVEEDRFSLELPNGTYRVYAFANISPAQLAQASGLTFTEGAAAPAVSAAEWAPDLNQWPTGADGYSSALPMTGHIPALQVAQSFACDIAVVRLVAKLRFNIIDRTAATTAVARSVTIYPITEGPCALLPDYSALGDFSGQTGAYAPAAANGLTARELTLELPAPVAGATPAATAWAYVRESSAADGLPAANPSGRFQLRVSVSRNGADVATDIFALTDALASICRNDYVTIPLVLTDYSLEADVNFYPPIGGYPAVVVEPQGNDYTITFGSAGEFAITLTVRDLGAGDGAQPIALADLGVAITVSDPDGIFTTAPAVDATTGELLGAVGSTAGAATVAVAVTVAQSATVTHTFTRTLHILRQ